MTTNPHDAAKAAREAALAANDADRYAAIVALADHEAYRVAQLNDEPTEHRLPDGTRLTASAVDDDSAMLDVAVERMIEGVKRGG